MSNVCDVAGSNTGRPKCDPRLGKIEYPYFTISAEFTKEEMDDPELLAEAIDAKLKLPNGDPNKLYRFPKMREAADNTGDPTSVTLADGYEEFIDALPKYLLTSTPGNCQWAAMSSFNGWPGTFFAIDDKKQFIAKRKADGGGTGIQIGNLYTDKPRFGANGAINAARTRLSIANADEMLNLKFTKVTFDIEGQKNLVDVVLVDRENENDSGSANNVLKIGIVTSCDETDMYSAYKALLDDPSLWRISLPDDTAINLDTVTAEDATKSFVLTIDPTDYSAIPLNSTFFVDLAVPADLADAGVTGVEAKRLRFKKYA